MSIRDAQKNISYRRRYVIALISIVWLSSAFWASSPLIGWSSVVYNPNNLMCSVSWKSRDFGDVTFTTSYLVFGILLPFAVKVFCYRHVFQKTTILTRRLNRDSTSLNNLALRVSRMSQTSYNSRGSRNSLLERPGKRGSIGSTNSLLHPPNRRTTNARKLSQRSWSTHSTKSMEISNQERFGTSSQEGTSAICIITRLRRVMMFMIILTAVLWIPHAILPIIMMSTNQQFPTWWMLSIVLSKIGVVTNPILYIAFNRKFRHNFGKALICEFRSGRVFTPPLPNHVNPALYPPERLRRSRGHSVPRRRMSDNLLQRRRFSALPLATITEVCSTAGLAGSRQVTDGSESGFTPVVSPLNRSQCSPRRASLPENEIREGHLQNMSPETILKTIQNSRKTSLTKQDNHVITVGVLPLSRNDDSVIVRDGDTHSRNSMLHSRQLDNGTPGDTFVEVDT